jgi:hypothetical protein
MKGKILGLLAMGLLAGPMAANAVPYTIEYQSTISSIFGTPISGLNIGDSVRFSVSFDNGGSSQASQTWGASNILSVAFDFGAGTRVTSFNSPFDGGIQFATGSYSTNSSGVLTSVMVLYDSASANFSSNGPGTSFSWFINGGNVVYGESSSFGSTGININNVGGDIVAGNWSFVAPVPEPGTLALLSLGLLGLGVSYRKA